MGLFEGIGGFSLAGRCAGWETPVMVEWNAYCQAVLKKNFPHATIFGDIRQFDGRPYAGQIDIITGGFPCQPYSHAGLRHGNDDDRALWPEMLRVIREVRPRWVVGENVAGLLSMDGGRVFGAILADLENEGYTTETFVIPAVAVGAPHRRDRVWIVAHSEGKRFGKAGRYSERQTERTAGGDRASFTDAIEQPAGVFNIDGDSRQGREFAGTLQPEGLRQENWPISTERIEPDSGSRFAPHTQSTEQKRPGAARSRRDGFADGNIATADASGTGLSRGEQFGAPEQRSWTPRPTTERHCNGGQWHGHWHEVATRICGMDDGFPTGVDGAEALPAKAKKGKAHRLEALGNAIVPQIAYQIFKAINNHEQTTR